MAAHTGLLLLIRYDDTVKTEPTTNDTGMLYSPLKLFPNILLSKNTNEYEIKTDLEKKNLLCKLNC